MKTKLGNLAFASITAIAAAGALLVGAAPAVAQVAGGTTTVGVTVVESTQLAMGWSVKKTLLGKTIYNDAGQKVGKVEDLIISPDKNLSYVIVGAGGFVGIGRHDVAIPVTQIQDKQGKLVMAGASKDMIKGMPQFAYTTDTSKRDALVAAADKDISKGKAVVAKLEKQADAATTEAKAKIGLDITALKLDMKSVETKLTQMKQSSAGHWKDFEADVNAATARLRVSIEKSAG
jgi:sporulation protein YlmC with PRC-barrel domain